MEGRRRWWVKFKKIYLNEFFAWRIKRLAIKAKRNFIENLKEKFLNLFVLCVGLQEKF